MVRKCGKTAFKNSLCWDCLCCGLCGTDHWYCEEKKKVRQFNFARHLHVLHSSGSLAVRWTLGLTLDELCCWTELAPSASNWVLRTGKRQMHVHLYNRALWVKQPPLQVEAWSYLQRSGKLLVCLLLFQASLATVEDFGHGCKTEICFRLSGTHLWAQQLIWESITILSTVFSSSKPKAG